MEKIKSSKQVSAKIAQAATKEMKIQYCSDLHLEFPIVCLQKKGKPFVGVAHGISAAASPTKRIEQTLNSDSKFSRW